MVRRYESLRRTGSPAHRRPPRRTHQCTCAPAPLAWIQRQTPLTVSRWLVSLAAAFLVNPGHGTPRSTPNFRLLYRGCPDTPHHRRQLQGLPVNITTNSACSVILAGARFEIDDPAHSSPPPRSRHPSPGAGPAGAADQSPWRVNIASQLRRPAYVLASWHDQTYRRLKG